MKRGICNCSGLYAFLRNAVLEAGEAEPKVFFARLSGSRGLAGSLGAEVLGARISLTSGSDGEKRPRKGAIQR